VDAVYDDSHLVCAILFFPLPTYRTLPSANLVWGSTIFFARLIRKKSKRFHLSAYGDMNFFHNRKKNGCGSGGFGVERASIAV